MGSGNMDKKDDGQVRVKRPVERQKMRPWLVDLLNSGSIEGLTWENKEDKTFKINWKHGSRHGYNANRDASLFEKYAELTGRKDAKNPNPKKWKANFRCALHSLGDVEELKSRGNTRGHDAFRVYQFLDGPKPKSKVTREQKQNKPGLSRKRKYNRRQRVTSYESDTEEEDEETRQPCSPSSISAEIPSSPGPALTFKVTEEKLQSSEPGITRYTFPSIFSGCVVITKDVSRSASAPIMPSTSVLEMVNRPNRPASHESVTAHSSSEVVPAKRRRTDSSPACTVLRCDSREPMVSSLETPREDEEEEEENDDDSDDDSGQESDSGRESCSESDSETEVREAEVQNTNPEFHGFAISNVPCVLDVNVANEEVVESTSEVLVYTDLQPSYHYGLRSQTYGWYSISHIKPMSFFDNVNNDDSKNVNIITLRNLVNFHRLRLV
ncbi:hypothetical protein FSP39_009135 [Pinctada imbricata]|uniref:IRF tryptophan pentad repeat domain-containing protein n=1 Tax=Pinctada imbricata TaxID=66713 RepID=A0AA88Y5W7_PINIB|nr:hypothetical protein FSP39_009135 [Pinctada imbricata]